MNPSPIRIVLGFYSNNDDASSAYEAVAGVRHGPLLLLGPDGLIHGKGRIPPLYANLRLPDESLLAIHVRAADIDAVLNTVKNVGNPAVFILRPERETPPPPVPPTDSRADGSFAARCAGETEKVALRSGDILAMLRSYEKDLDRVRKDLAETARLERPVSVSAKWLVDNAYLIRAAIAEVRRHLPQHRGVFGIKSSDGLPHAYGLAEALVAHSDHAIQETNILEALRDYQTIAPLSIAELWSFPLMLRAALLRSLTLLVQRVDYTQEMREIASLWANRLAAFSRQAPDPQLGIVNRLETEPRAGEPAFLTHLSELLQDEELILGPLQQWMEMRLGTSVADLVRNEHAREAAEALSISQAFGSLRALSHLEFSDIFEAASLVEAELRNDPGKIYGRSDFITRDRCRRAVENISRHGPSAELDVARQAVVLASQATQPEARHVAYYLLDGGVLQLENAVQSKPPVRIRAIRAVRRRATAVYLGSITGLTVCFLALALDLAWVMKTHQETALFVLGVLSLFPLSELATQIVNALVISLFPPDPLAKLNLKDGIATEQATLVVVPIMLSGPHVVKQELEKLEVRFLANPDRNLFFSLFTDFTDAAKPNIPGDEELLQIARDGIAALNARYPGDRFLLFHRPREWSPSEQSWIGPDRKRGKIEDLNAFLTGQGDPSHCVEGKLTVAIRYVITLDADTQLPPGAARRMVETIAHPLNAVTLDPVTRVRRRGFTIIQPRVSISLPGATVTRFTRILADTAGTDPYCQTVSDAQQDLFGEAIFHGKAIYDVEAFWASVGKRFPSELILSHDLIEGAHAGVGLASDIELFEDMPLDYASYCRRQHRWIRGDWQIASWVLPEVPTPDGRWGRNPLTFVNRWRIFDNLRRSLVPLASLLLLVFGWFISTAPGTWTLVVGLALAIPAIAPLLERLARHAQGSMRGWQGAWDELIRAVVTIAFLPHQAWISVDAIAKVGYRQASKRRLLEWHTAERVTRDSRLHISVTMRQMLVISGLCAVLVALLHLKNVLAPTSAFIALWILSPALMYWLTQPISIPGREELDRTDTIRLRKLARHTWRYFDDLVGSQSNWLPPDNSQLALNVEVAQRTSPTNIGMWLTSSLAARDFGYLTVDEWSRRCSQTMATLDRLERYEGHFLNWYDTQNLQPLLPRYVSTVDSGNLLACLWVFDQGCREGVHASLIGRSATRGLADTLAALRGACGKDSSVAVPIQSLRRLLRGKADGQELIGRLRLAVDSSEKLLSLTRWQTAPHEEPAYWAAQLHEEIRMWNELSDRYLKWLETLMRPPESFLKTLAPGLRSLRQRISATIPSLASLASGDLAVLEELLSGRDEPGLSLEVSSWLHQVNEEYEQAQANARATMKSLEELGSSAGRIAGAINMRFLYDSRRRLFGIGYSVGSPMEFTSHYDLLASECRLTSLVAIAKGDVPREHWFSLGRPRVASPGGQSLLSWNGTAFEYLMPLLFARSYANSLLDYACKDAVARQIDHGRQQKVPWGVSESAYSAIDAHRTYQYRAFGVQELALKAGVDQDAVVSPYSTVLALQVDRRAALENIAALEHLGMYGPMGLYESVDFSREKAKKGDRGVIVYAYMSHHQGMSLLALDNVLHRDVMQQRFHMDLRVRAMESLLYERLPATEPPRDEIRDNTAVLDPIASGEPAERVMKEVTSIPRVHIYGSSQYSLMMTNSGSGYSQWNGIDLTRWRSDTTSDQWGSFLYLRDIRSEMLWSATYQPLGAISESGSARFSADKAEFQRRVTGIETNLEITVSTEDNVEIRRLTVMNRSMRNRQLEITSYLELALTAHAADTAHPAFAKMFVETEYAGDGVLIAHRRGRSPEDPPIWAALVLAGASGPIQYESDRLKFLGRGETSASARALRRDLSGTVGTVLDPVFSMRCRAALDPRDRMELSFITMAADSREKLDSLVAKYRKPEAAARAFEIAWTRSQLEFRYLGIGPSHAHRFQELAGHLLYPNAKLRALDRMGRNRLGQSALWAYGISGDLPILTVTIADNRNLPLIRELLLAHTYWRMHGFRADLVVLNQEPPSYDAPLRQQLQRQIEAHSTETGVDRPGGVFLRDWFSIPEEGRTLLLAASNGMLAGSRGSLQQQLSAPTEGQSLPPFVPAGGIEEPSQPLPFLELPYFNGIGGFSQDGREYAIYLKPGDATPSPWVNVIATPKFGTVVSESGLGFTWRGNSQTNRLTPWHNDPVSDPQSEVIYLRDDETGACWTPTPLPIRENDAYRARHGQGYTVFEHNSHAIGQELTVFIPATKDGTGDPVKVYRLRLRNDSSRPRRITVTYFAELVLGAIREIQRTHIATSKDPECGALLARQWWNGHYLGHYAFAAMSPSATSYSTDRAEFLGPKGSASKLAALGRARLGNRTGVGLDPAMALQLQVSLDRGGRFEVIVLLGQCESVEEVRAIVRRYQTPEQIEGALAVTKQWWESLLGTLQVRTPVQSANFLLNRWLLYQDLSCRFWARSGFYQSSGAFGFRDQIQDSMALLYAAPNLARAHLLESAAHQFKEGDVLHWWHPEDNQGVRTRCSDDLVWLPYTVARYVKVTGDRTILDEPVSFMEGPQLSDGEQEHLLIPEKANQSAPLWEHCKRALDRALRTGGHGLPLFGSGDWNDGMNTVGKDGKGESVWLAWFLCATLDSAADMMKDREPALAAMWRERSRNLAIRVEQSSWDGSWYLRGYFDNGALLGSSSNPEAKIDSLPQSWAVISGHGDAARARIAMDSSEAALVDSRNKMVLLFTPPFDHSQPHPGYIMGYPPGIRENGGQYTHGSLWMAKAWALLGDGDRAVRLLNYMNPVEHSRNLGEIARYMGEPYVAAADVYSAPGKVGRCGWTWYTGSAGWMYRIWVEDVLGFQLRGDRLEISPSIPQDWSGFELTYRYHSTVYDVQAQRGNVAETMLQLDGTPTSGCEVTLVDDGKNHQIAIMIPKKRWILELSAALDPRVSTTALTTPK